MSDELGILKQIIQHPDDDDARLIYADLLEEQGSPQAEFIRLQVEIGRHEFWQPEMQPAYDQSQQILEENESSWKKAVGIDGKVNFHRGLIDSAVFTTGRLFKSDLRFLEMCPIQHVRITHWGDEDVERFRDSGLLGELPGLNFANSRSVGYLTALLPSVNGNLKYIDLSGLEFALENDLAELLTSSKVASSLEVLLMRATFVTPKFLKILGGSAKGFENLKRFEFGGGLSRFAPTHFDRLKMPKLKHLKVGGKLRAVDVNQLCYLPLSKLERLDLRNTKLPAVGLRMMLDQDALKNVERLNLSNCNLSLKSLRDLVDKGAKNLTHLDVSENVRLTEEFVVDLENSKLFPKLKYLRITDTGCKKNKNWDSYRFTVVNHM